MKKNGTIPQPWRLQFFKKSQDKQNQKLPHLCSVLFFHKTVITPERQLFLRWARDFQPGQTGCVAYPWPAVTHGRTNATPWTLSILTWTSLSIVSGLKTISSVSQKQSQSNISLSENSRVVHAFNPNTWEAKTGRSLLVWSKPTQHNEFQSSQIYIVIPCLKMIIPAPRDGEWVKKACYP